MRTFLTTTMAAVVALLLGSVPARAALYGSYTGNGIDSDGGTIGFGQMTLTGNSTSVSGQINRGGTIGTGFNHVFVLFIDSVSGGFSDTTRFTDGGNILRTAISGYGGPGLRASAYFAPGFQADYAIAISPYNGYGYLYELGTGEFNQLANVWLYPSDGPNYLTYKFSFNWADIGVAEGSELSFKFQSSYVLDSGYRSLESFETLTGTRGFGTVNFDHYNTFPPVPEPTTTALAAFAGIFVTARAAKALRSRFKSSK